MVDIVDNVERAWKLLQDMAIQYKCPACKIENMTCSCFVKEVRDFIIENPGAPDLRGMRDVAQMSLTLTAAQEASTRDSLRARPVESQLARIAEVLEKIEGHMAEDANDLGNNYRLRERLVLAVEHSVDRQHHTVR